MVAGRTNQARTVSVTTTDASTALTAPANSFNEEDKGAKITGTGIQAGTTLATITSDKAAVMSAQATAPGTVNAKIGGGATSALGYGFEGWTPESDAESEAYTVAAVNAGTVPPDRISDTTTPITRRART